MHQGKASNTWLRHVAVAGAYALSYFILSSVSLSHFMLPAGLRLACLLWVPYRYWPALIVGEMIPFAYTSYNCVDQYGMTWALVNLIPQIALAMPIVVWFRRHVSLFGPKHAVNMGGLLLCALAISIAASWLDVAHVAVMQLPPGYVVPTPLRLALEYFLGGYIGILTLVPLLLMIRDARRSGVLRELPKHLAQSRLTLDFVCLLLPVLALLVWLSVKASGEFLQMTRIAMFLPVAWLTLRHGWFGAALGGAAVSVAVMLTMRVYHDPAVLQAQAFIGFAITTLLILGAHIATLRVREHKGQLDGQLALQLAQQGLYLGELRARQTAQALQHMGRTFQQSQQQLLAQLRYLWPAVDDARIEHQTEAAHRQVFRLADSLHPHTWRERGLPSELREGAIAHALADMGVAYYCELSGSDLSRLAPDVHATLYRLACEALVHLFAQKSMTRVQLTLRGGHTHGRRWAVLRVEGWGSYAAADISNLQADRLQLIARLGALGQDIHAIRDRARLYGGELHVNTTNGRVRLTLLLHDAVEQAGV